MKTNRDVINVDGNGWKKMRLIFRAAVPMGSGLLPERKYPQRYGRSKLIFMLCHDGRDANGLRKRGYCYYYLSRPRKQGKNVLLHDKHWKMLLDVLHIPYEEVDGIYSVNHKQAANILREAANEKTLFMAYIKEKPWRRVDKLKEVR